MDHDNQSKSGKDNNFKIAFKDIMKGNFAGPSTEDSASAPNDITRTTNSSQFSQSQYSKAEVKTVYSPFRTSGGFSSDSPSESIITKDMLIEGNITLNSRIRILGTIKGNVTSKDDISVEGKIDGNIKGNNVYLSDSVVSGNIQAKGNITLNERSALTGDSRASNIICDGRINGDLTAINLVALNSTAVVVGNIHSQSIRIQDDAMLKGTVDVFNEQTDKHRKNDATKASTSNNESVDGIAGEDKNEDKKE